MVFFNRIFLGLVLIVVGVLYILKDVVGLNIPVWGIIWPTLLILWGLSILAWPWSRRKSDHQILFDEGGVEVTDKNEKYEAIFGKGVFDFRKIAPPKEGAKKVEVNAVFGGVEMVIDENIPMVIKASGAFGGVHLPDGNTAAFGDRTYKTKAYREDKPYIFVKASAVFGGIEVRE